MGNNGCINWIVGGAGKNCGESCGDLGMVCDSSVRTNTISELEDRLNKAGRHNPKISHGSWKTGSGLNPAYLPEPNNEWVLGNVAPDCDARVDQQRQGLCHCSSQINWIVGGAGKNCGE